MPILDISELFNDSENYLKIINFILTFKNKKVSITNLIKYIKKEFNIELIFKEEYKYLYSSKRLIYHLELFNINVPKCYNINCSQNVKWHQNKYSKFCSSKCANKHPESIKKIEKTSLKRYGTLRPSQSAKSIEKLLSTNLKKFGYISSAMHPEIKEKAKKTNLKKYGSNSSSQNNLKNKKYYYNKEFIINNFFNKKKEFLLSNFMKFFNCGQVSAHTQIKRLGINYEQHRGISRLEKEILSFIKDNYSGKIITNDRKVLNGLELDIYLPELKLAFEINGVYWHSYGLNNISEKQNNLKFQKNRHLVKTKGCEFLNIQLIHIFENEFIEKPEIWKSVILNKIGKSSIRYYARKLEIKEVSSKEAKLFLKKTHLQSSINSSIRIGLYNGNNLISLMTFGKMRFSKTKINAFELLRFSTELNTTCVGCGSKLLKYFERNYLKDNLLYSFANRRWSKHNNNIYTKLNFEKIGYIEPSKYIFSNSNPYKLYSRIAFQKHKLKKKLDNFDSSKTALENIIQNGYRIIWDSGNIKYLYKRS